MALQVCAELEKMVAAVGSFRGFLGPQFISISGEAQVITQAAVGLAPAQLCPRLPATIREARTAANTEIVESVLQQVVICDLAAALQAVERLVGRVDELAACVQRVDFDIFDRAHGAEWRNVKAAFDARNELVGGVTKELINTSFRCDPSGISHLNSSLGHQI